MKRSSEDWAIFMRRLTAADKIEIEALLDDLEQILANPPPTKAELLRRVMDPECFFRLKRASWKTPLMAFCILAHPHDFK